MRQAWKPPKNLRLKKIEEWRRNRYERAIRQTDRAKAWRATELYIAAAAHVGDAFGRGAVSIYSDHE
jgi:hypothetical protein